MGIYYEEQSGKGFKAKLKVSEEELEKYLEFWGRDEDLSGVCFSNVLAHKINMSFSV